ncbi:uncharacterized protein LOC118841349 [Trichosurus vulpecula]|uniref:uncharacterized protein LOC118841349 n=1 Tax=Trichosurus vulpecula TaxID=9337 RepID=UPI00186AFEC5|nr:uncharacterized protein LOC118841349 [Trichosurus vulpecula]
MTSRDEQAGTAIATVVVEVASLPEAGHDTFSSRFLLGGPKMPLLHSGGPEEAEQEFLEKVRAVLGSVSRGYSVSVLIRGREAKQLDLVPQLLAMLFEEIQPPDASEPSLRTLSLVQLSSSGRGRDLLLPGASDLTLLDVCPLGLVVEGVSEAEILDSKSGCQLYLKAMEGLDRDCPLLLALAGKASKAHMGSLPWIVTRLLFGNSYSSLLLHLDPQATPLSLLLASLSGPEGARDPAQLKQVSPTLWDASEEIQARRAAIQDLRSGLSGIVLQETQLTQLSLVLRELKVLKNQSRYWESRLLKEAEASAPRCQKLQAPDVALQFKLAQANRQLLQEHHRSQIQEELSCLGQDEEIAGDQVSPRYLGKENQRQDHAALVLQLETMKVERDAAERDLEALYELHVQGARAQTCHMLQVFRACRRLWKEQADAREFHHRILLARVLEDAVSLATQTQQLQVQNKQLQQGEDYEEEQCR